MSDLPFLPFAQPWIESEEISAAIEVLRSGWFTQGPRVADFEKSFSNYLGGGTAVALSSATAGLHLSLLTLDIGPGDEVITSPFTFASTANVVELVGATPVFADIDEQTLNIDIESIKARTTSKTKAILVVHFAGLPCEMDQLLSFANSKGIALIEDAAHALGAVYRGKKIGALSDFAVFSFYPIKNMTAIEGGMLITRNNDLAQRTKVLRWYGLSEGVWERLGSDDTRYSEVLEPGFKYNMNDLQAAVGLVQLRRLDEFNKRRKALAEQYLALLDGVSEIRSPVITTGYAESACHLFVVRVNPSAGIGRAELVERLKRRKIGTSYHYKSLHLHPFYSKKYSLKPGDFPVATRASSEVVSLPLFPQMQQGDVERVVAAIREALVRK